MQIQVEIMGEVRQRDLIAAGEIKAEPALREICSRLRKFIERNQASPCLISETISVGETRIWKVRKLFLSPLCGIFASLTFCPLRTSVR